VSVPGDVPADDDEEDSNGDQTPDRISDEQVGTRRRQRRTDDQQELVAEELPEEEGDDTVTLAEACTLLHLLSSIHRLQHLQIYQVFESHSKKHDADKDDNEVVQQTLLQFSCRTDATPDAGCHPRSTLDAGNLEEEMEDEMGYSRGFLGYASIITHASSNM